MDKTAAGFQPSYLFALVTLVAASAGAVAVRESTPANIVFVCLAIGSAGFAGLALYRMLGPLLSPLTSAGPDMLGGRTRAALDLEKALVLRGIKELEFDRAMGKLSEPDFREMSHRLRVRAVGLIKQLASGSAGYREVIERELALRQLPVAKELFSIGLPAAETNIPQPAAVSPSACVQCGTLNDSDAQFCKQCGNKLPVMPEPIP